MIALSTLLAYLLGSVAFGVVWAWVFGLGDLRRIGSGNIGATNVLRTGNRPAAFLTLVCDAGKGATAVLAARWALGETAAQLAGIAAFLGHCYPVFLGFKGGKGVAVWLGTVLALAWPVGLALGATWIATAFAFRISSLAAIVAAVSGPVWAVLLGRPGMALVLIALGALIVVFHRANIRRMRAGTEPRIGKGR